MGKKQPAGICSMLGVLGTGALVAGLAVLLAGAARDEDETWEKSDILITSTAPSACTYQCDCTRVCLSGDAESHCRSARRCESCAGVQGIWSGTSPLCGNATLTRNFECGAKGLGLEVGDTADAFANNFCTRFAFAPEDFPAGVPPNYLDREGDKDPSYLIRAGAIVMGAGALFILCAVTAYIVTAPYYERARKEYEEHRQELMMEDRSGFIPEAEVPEPEVAF